MIIFRFILVTLLVFVIINVVEFIIGEEQQVITIELPPAQLTPEQEQVVQRLIKEMHTCEELGFNSWEMLFQRGADPEVRIICKNDNFSDII